MLLKATGIASGLFVFSMLGNIGNKCQPPFRIDMIIVLDPHITAEQRQQLQQHLPDCQTHEIAGKHQILLGLLAPLEAQTIQAIKAIAGVRQVIPNSPIATEEAGTETVMEWLTQLGQMAHLLQQALQHDAAPKIKQGISSGISISRAVKVAFQGEPGAYSEQALFQFFHQGQSDTIYFKEQFNGLEVSPCPDFRTMFEAVQHGHVAFAVVPLENSLAGPIMENHDLLMEYPDVCICAETRLRVSHTLIAAKGSTLEQIKQVRSHPQALAQSSHFLQKHGLQPVANFDTAGSVRELKEQPNSTVAAIASALAAEIHDMEILAQAIESNHRNYTRFAIACRWDSPLLHSKVHSHERQGIKFGNKWSMCLTLHHSSGSLATALNIFQKYQLDLTRLESRPIMGQPWSYRFYIDTLLSAEMKQSNNQAEAAFFAELNQISEQCQVLGRYWQNLN